MVSPLLAAATLAVAQAPAPPQLPAPPQAAASLTWLEGSWRGPGTMFDRASEARLEVRPALGGRFMELSWSTGGFEGRAFYRPAGWPASEGGGWRATWFDSRGISFPILAVATPRLLTAHWGSEDTERGRTTYRLLPDGRLEVIDHAGGRDFASHILTRE